MLKDESRRNEEAKAQDGLEEVDQDLKAILTDAFDDVRLPEVVRERTLKAVESARDAESRTEAPAAFRRKRAKRHPLRFAYGMAACFILVLVTFFGVDYVNAPTAYIDLDINPSIELAVNRFDYVVGSEAINEDAREILEKIDVVGKSSTDAVEEIMSEIITAGYDPEESLLELSISSDNADQADTLESNLDAIVRNCGYIGSCSVVDGSVRIEAQSNSMGMGKYLAAQELISLDPNVTMEECSHLSMRQIRDRIAVCEGQSNEIRGQANGANRSENEPRGNGGNGAGNGYGYGADGNDHGHHGTRYSQ